MKISLYNREFYENKYNIKIAAYYFRNWDSHRMQFHKHNRIEIMYVVNGQCTIDARDDKFKLVGGDMILIDSGVDHRITMAEGERCRMLNIEMVFEPSDNAMPLKQVLGEDFLSTKFICDKKPHIVFKDGDYMYSYLNLIVAELTGDCSEKLLSLQAAQMLIKISQMYQKQSTSKRVKSVVYVNKSLNYINHHYHEDIKVGDISERVGVNKNYLQRKFKEDTGTTIIGYLNDVRIDKAKQLLRKTEIPIIDLCLYVGINSRQYFTTLFKKKIGISPQEYRKNFINSSWRKSHDC